MKVDVAQNVYVYQVQMEDAEMIPVTLDFWMQAAMCGQGD